MLLYYLRLAVKSVLATPAVSALTVGAMALGIAVPAGMLSVHHVFARDPFPDRSDRLFNVRVDSWELESEFFDIQPGDPPKHVTYRDMAGLMREDLSTARTGIATVSAFAFPESADLRPYRTLARLCHADFFAMFGAPFAYGSAWTREADERRDRVVVLAHRSNEKLFGGEDSVGRRVRLGTQEYTVVGVLAPWRPTPQAYDVINNAFGEVREFFLPFDTFRFEGSGLNLANDTDSFGSFDQNDPDSFFDASEVTWIQYWVELAPERVADYAAFVDSYATSQKELGRFPRELNNRVTPLMEWMEVRGVVPPESKAMVVISLLFLVVCCLNLTGLLLAKFLARSGVLGVHRALGASRGDVFLQRLLECEVVGVAGGLVGLVLAAVSLRLLDGMLPDQQIAEGVISADAFTLGACLALALVAGVLSGIYPAWRACRVAPAIQLKLQ